MMNQEQFNYTLNLKLRTNRVFFGSGVVELLQRISQTGSLNTAAKQMKMSYNKAWRIIQKAEQELGFALIHKSVGGSNGGGSKVTEDGKQLTAKFLLFQKKTYYITNQLFNEIFSEDLKSLEEKE
ncbi:winged helix-turn-helix domain-containing protein [Enterococcus sp. LJL99]